ncbi:MAG: radical SAM protein [Acidobacteria bacterium]|nr:radical SAM protein [Acidobacteriota bacterium]
MNYMTKTLGRGLSTLANAAWKGVRAGDRLFPERTFKPKWAPSPLQKTKDMTAPTMGFPRETDSLCPGCIIEVRESILSGEVDYRVLIDGNPGEIKAQIIERDNQVWMVKECPKHGRYEDLMAKNADFLKRMEDLFPGRDFKMAPDDFHDHGTSTVKFGRGAVLTVDLTNRCNMMCNPCFMDANQVGYVHELTWEEIQKILDDSIQVRPRRQMSVQFSGGEPTISPHFLKAVAYARKVGYDSVQAATNGIRFAQDLAFARQAKQAGLRLAYLQFDGVDNESNSHRGVGNLYDVKQRAIDNLAQADVDVCLVTTIINTVNNDQVGPIVKFMIQNIEKVNAVAFQPVSFTGRDEAVDDKTRAKQRYTLSHLAEDLGEQLGQLEPMRDFYPLSASGPFSDLKDLLSGPDADWGSMKCGCHPNCGIGTMLLINQKTHEWVPIPKILNIDQLLQDVRAINDSGRGKKMTATQFGLALMRNFRWSEAPKGLKFKDFFTAIDGHLGRKMGVAKETRYEWRIIMVAGMWFQDLFNYDFRRTEMCIIPYGTQVGEVSFCAYNTGVGWRNIVEEMFKTASTVEWFKTKGRHPIYAGGHEVALPAMTTGAAAASSGGEAGNGNGHSLSNNNGNGNGNGHKPLDRKVAITKLPSLREDARA